jgi:hypothetical protein
MNPRNDSEDHGSRRRPFRGFDCSTFLSEYRLLHGFARADISLAISLALLAPTSDEQLTLWGAPWTNRVIRARLPSRGRTEFPVNLHKELIAEAFTLLEKRSRLSRRLWSEIVKRRRPNEDSGLIRERILRSTIERQKLVQLER